MTVPAIAQGDSHEYGVIHYATNNRSSKLDLTTVDNILMVYQAQDGTIIAKKSLNPLEGYDDTGVIQEDLANGYYIVKLFPEETAKATGVIKLTQKVLFGDSVEKSIWENILYIEPSPLADVHS